MTFTEKPIYIMLYVIVLLYVSEKMWPTMCVYDNKLFSFFFLEDSD